MSTLKKLPVNTTHDTARIVCGWIYVTVQCSSVCLSHHLAAACSCSGFAAVGPAAGRYRLTAQWRPPCAALQQRLRARQSAANAGSVTLSANVGSRTQTRFDVRSFSGQCRHDSTAPGMRGMLGAEEREGRGSIIVYGYHRRLAAMLYLLTHDQYLRQVVSVIWHKAATWPDHSIQWRSKGVGRVGKVQVAPECRGLRIPGQKNNNNFLVTVKIRTCGYQTLECFTATLST